MSIVSWKKDARAVYVSAPAEDRCRHYPYCFMLLIEIISIPPQFLLTMVKFIVTYQRFLCKKLGAVNSGGRVSAF